MKITKNIPVVHFLGSKFANNIEFSLVKVKVHFPQPAWLCVIASICSPSSI